MTCTITKCLSVDGGYYLEGLISDTENKAWAVWTANFDHDLKIIKFTPKSLTDDEIEVIKKEIKRYRTKIVYGGFV